VCHFLRTQLTRLPRATRKRARGQTLDGVPITRGLAQYPVAFHPKDATLLTREGRLHCDRGLIFNKELPLLSGVVAAVSNISGASEQPHHALEEQRRHMSGRREYVKLMEDWRKGRFNTLSR